MPPRRKGSQPLSPNGKSPDELVSATAARQWGAFTGAQARTAGLTQRQIDYRVSVKRWRREARDVFVLSGTRKDWQQAAAVACLSGPVGTVASHLTAAAVYGLAKAPAEAHVTMPRKANGERIRGAEVRRADLSAGDKAVKDRLACTSPVRTVLDCAELLDQEGLGDLVDSALCRKLMQPGRLIRETEGARRGARGSRRAGLGRLLEALEVWRSGAPPGSPPEASCSVA